MSFFFERPQSILGQSTARGEATLGDIWAAQAQADRTGFAISAGEEALRQAYDARISAIEEATGERLVNPLDIEADPSPLFFPSNQIFRPAINAMGGDERRADAFGQQLVDLAQRFPEAADVIGVDRPIQDDAYALARQADTNFGQLFASSNDWRKYIASFGGSMQAMAEDPLQVATAFVGAVPNAAARTFGARLLSVTAREMAINGAAEAAMQPFIAEWRNRAGLSYGLGDAISQVALSAAFGGLVGAAATGAGEGVAALLRRRLSPLERDLVAGQLSGDARVAPEMRAALAGDADAAARVLAPVRETLPPAARGALNQAELEASVVAPARTAALEVERDAIGERSLPPSARPEVIPEGDSRLAAMPREDQRIETNWRLAALDDRIDEIEARLANDEAADDIARDIVRREGLAPEGVAPLRQMVRDVQIKLAIPSQDSEAFTIWRDDYLAREDVRARRDAAAGNQSAVDEATQRAFVAQDRQVQARVEQRQVEASRAIEGDADALATLRAADPQMRSIEGERLAPAQPPKPAAAGLVDPFDDAALAREVEALEIDEGLLGTGVDDGEGNFVPLADLLASADEEMALARMVALCRI